MLEQFKHDLEIQASLAPEYTREKRSSALVTLFANKYCEAVDSNDESNKNIYYSCIILKFWDQFTKICKDERLAALIKNKKIDSNDILDEFLHCINVALDGRVWNRAGSKTNAQACINQVLSSRAVGELLRPFNLKKNEGQVFQKSLDDTLTSDGSATILDTVGEKDLYNENQLVLDTVQAAINHNKIIEAIIFDNIAFTDCQKYEKEVFTTIDRESGKKVKVSRTVSSFWAYKLVKELNALGKNYFEYFTRTYNIDSKKLLAALEEIKKSSNSKLYKMIEASQNYGKSLLA